MILCLDVGNSNITIGCCKDDDSFAFVSRLRSDVNRTIDEYAVLIQSILNINNCDISLINGACISSVVPALSSMLKKAIAKLKKMHVIIVGPGIKSGVNIKIDNPAQLGSDLVCAAVAAVKKYPVPSVVIDLGTATTFSVIDENQCILGGAIYPGIAVSLSALSARTAQLPQNISLDNPPKNIIGTNTTDSMKSGMIFCTASMIDGMIERFNAQFDTPLTVIATGGLACDIIPHCKSSIIGDENLLLDGLKIIFDKNC